VTLVGLLTVDGQQDVALMQRAVRRAVGNRADHLRVAIAR